MGCSFGVFACSEIGRLAIELFKENKEQLKFVVLDHADMWNLNERILDTLSGFKSTSVYYYTNDDEILDVCRNVDAVILAFWGRKIKGDLLKAPKFGYLNLHTSYLPYGKGKHPHYWSLVDEKPYGVTIMKIDSGLDTGEIIFQKEIEILWSDTGKTLYFKAIYAMKSLLIEKKDEILNLNFQLMKQDNVGTHHYAYEIEDSSHIDLEREYKAKDLLNIIRARTFRPFPAAYFTDSGKKYEVTINIAEVVKEFNGNEINYEEIMNDYRNLCEIEQNKD